MSKTVVGVVILIILVIIIVVVVMSRHGKDPSTPPAVTYTALAEYQLYDQKGSKPSIKQVYSDCTGDANCLGVSMNIGNNSANPVTAASMAGGTITKRDTNYALYLKNIPAATPSYAK